MPARGLVIDYTSCISLILCLKENVLSDAEDVKKFEILLARRLQFGETLELDIS